MHKRVHSQAEVEKAVALPARVAQDAANYTREQLEPLFEESANAIVVIDEQFHVIDCNAVACEKLGWKRSEATGQHCSKVLGCMNLNRMALCGTSSCPLTRVLLKNAPIPNEELICGASPDFSAEYAVGVTPIKAGERRIIVFSAREVSALKVVNSVRSNFISMVSHELRTPLNSVHGFIDLILQGHMGPLTEDQQTYLGYTQEGVQQLISIVEDILFMTRSDLGQFLIKPQQVQLSTVAKQVLLSMQPQALKGSVVLSHDVPKDAPLLYVDPGRIKQVLNNLVANAIKFTPPGGSVKISTRRHDEHFQLISVTDTGYGIMPEDRPHVFERFYQSNHSMQSRMGGYGLGLSIAQLIIEQHGGIIGFDTEVNKGTTFYFTIPVVVEQFE